MAGFEAMEEDDRLVRGNSRRGAARGRDGCRRVLDLIAWNWILVRPLFCLWDDVEKYSYAWAFPCDKQRRPKYWAMDNSTGGFVRAVEP